MSIRETYGRRREKEESNRAGSVSRVHVRHVCKCHNPITMYVN